MAQELINLGTGNDTGDGDPLRVALDKVNNNFTELYLQAGHASYTDSVHVDLATAFTVPANTDVIIPLNAGVIYSSEKPSNIDEFYFSGGFELSSIVGSFDLDETITGGTSGATAIVRRVGVSDLYFVGNLGVFLVGETITGSISGSTAVIDVNLDGHITGRTNDNLDVMLYFKAVPSNPSQWLDIWIDITGGTGTPVELSDLYREVKEFPKGTGVERGVLYSLPSAYTRGTWQANGGLIKLRSNASLEIYRINVNFDISYRAR